MKKVSEMTLAEKVGQVVVVGGAMGGFGKEKGTDDALCLIEEKFPHVRHNLSLSAFLYGSQKALKKKFSCNYDEEKLLNL